MIETHTLALAQARSLEPRYPQRLPPLRRRTPRLLARLRAAYAAFRAPAARAPKGGCC